MDKGQNHWTENILTSMQGSNRAMPKPELFGIIEEKLGVGLKNLIPMQVFRRYIAAAVLLLLVNSYVFLQSGWGDHDDTKISYIEHHESSLLINYNIYQ